MSLLHQTSYDEVPYESYPYSQTHPDRLAVMATLFGLRAAPASSCRVLELGCAAGGNLIPLAVAYPQSRFLGIDLSKVQVEEGLATVKELKLQNIELRAMNIADVAPELGKFDYILCHGVFSWVPTPVQERIFEICAANLSPHGVAYISYNTYPGWHMRGLIRDMLSYHVRPFTLPAMKVRQARNLLDFLARTAGRENSPYGLLLQSELESFRHSSDSYLFHEHLEECNDPIYFYQFMERATAKGLKYLGEADMRSMVPGNFPPEIENVLQMLSQDMVHMEQYMDFVRNRMFRQTLLVHARQVPNYDLRAEQMRRFHIASPARPAAGQEVKIDSPDVSQFTTPSGLALNTGDPLAKAAMAVLEQHWPRPIPFEKLVEEACARVTDPEEKKRPAGEVLANAVLSFYASASTSLVELWLHAPQFRNEVGEKPVASSLARLMASRGNRVTNLRQEPLLLDELGRQTLRLLDGTHDRAALLDQLGRLMETGELTVEKDGQPLAAEASCRELLPQALDMQLQHIARSALLLP